MVLFRAIKRWIQNYFKEYHKNSFVIPNFIDCDRIRKLSEEKCELNFKYICSVGRLVKEKGFDRLITAYTLPVKKEIERCKVGNSRKWL